MKPSGIGGQAVIEGIMMRNRDVYSIAVRKPDGEIEVVKKESKLTTEKYKFLNFPIIRGVFNFVDSLVIGVKTLTYSASFYEDEETQKDTKIDELGKKVFKDRFESVLMALTVVISIALAVGIFMVLPYFISRLLSGVIVSKTVLNIIEGVVRLAIFITYMVLISLMNDIKRVYMYHGAEHKCINCIETGLPLNVDNVRVSSRMHKRCGTSFMFLVMFVSIVFFIFIRFETAWLQLVVRLLLVPVIAGVSYEIIRWAGRHDNFFVKIVSAPGVCMQKLTTKEPDDSMIEVAIAAVEEVFDWREFLEAGKTLDMLDRAMKKRAKKNEGKPAKEVVAKAVIEDTKIDFDSEDDGFAVEDVDVNTFDNSESENELEALIRMHEEKQAKEAERRAELERAKQLKNAPAVEEPVEEYRESKPIVSEEEYIIDVPTFKKRSKK